MTPNTTPTPDRVERALDAFYGWEVPWAAAQRERMARALAAADTASPPPVPEELRRLSDAATPGPWLLGSWHGQCHKSSHVAGCHSGSDGDDPCVYDYALRPGGSQPDLVSEVVPITIIQSAADEIGRPNAEFIAALVNWFRSLSAPPSDSGFNACAPCDSRDTCNALELCVKDFPPSDSVSRPAEETQCKCDMPVTDARRRPAECETQASAKDLAGTKEGGQ